ncbi:MAG: proton-conducting membrane transporter [Eubacterium sp.]|nr:proton-conducting membrane transporter [Eubacterium sp.]
MNFWLILPAVFSAVGGIALLILSLAFHLREKSWETLKEDDKFRKKLHIYVMIVLAVGVFMGLYAAWGSSGTFMAFTFVEGIRIEFCADGIAKIFATLTSIIWVFCGFYSCRYMRHEKNELRYFGFFLVVYAVVIMLDFSGNLITFYLFYEMMTLTSMPLVLHTGTKEAISAAFKYLFYSLIGAYLALYCIYFLYSNTTSLTFAPGGTLDTALAAENGEILLLAVFFMLIGFGAKAGMFPLHAWLPSAHPVAPAPASAALSSIIVKGGILAIIRTLFYIVGADFIRGTWVQSAWCVLSLITVLMGSVMAFKTKNLKKRLAYSTVSQVSYVIFGLSLLSESGFEGAILQVVFHAFAKCALFLVAGIFIFETGKTDADDYKAIGKRLPVSLAAFLAAGLSLIGIPPFGGFVSKWYIASGALVAENSVLGYAGAIVLLISAVLTAGYLLPVAIKGFMPGKDDKTPKSKEKINLMNAAALLPAAIVLLLGIYPAALIEFIKKAADGIF